MAEDLLSAIVSTSKAFADPITSAYASANRTYHVVISRPGNPGKFNRDSGTWTGRTRITVYDGPARIWNDPGTATRTVGDEEIPFNDIRVSIDHDPARLPRVEDDLHVVADDQSVTGNLADRDFEIAGVEVGGFLEAGLVLSATGAAPSRHNPGT